MQLLLFLDKNRFDNYPSHAEKPATYPFFRKSFSLTLLSSGNLLNKSFLLKALTSDLPTNPSASPRNLNTDIVIKY